MAKKNKKKKMAFGGNVNDPLSQYFGNIYNQARTNPGVIQDPNQALAENDINKAKAMQSSNNLLPDLLSILGGAGMSIGLSGAQQNLPKKAYGGGVGKSAVEVEGGEVGELPDGSLVGFEGPSHAEGGIDVMMPDGSEIFSDRIKIDGVTMATRKKKRVSNEDGLTAKAKKNPSDALIKNALDRTKTVNQQEEAFDTQLQKAVSIAKTPRNKRKYAYGGEVVEGDEGLMSLLPQAMFQQLFFGDLDGSATPGMKPGKVAKVPAAVPEIVDTEGNSSGGLFKGGPTAGDLLGMGSNLFGAFSQKNNTVANRAGDNPNKNYFEEFGKDALKTLDESKGFAAGVRDSNLKALSDATLGAKRGNNRSARGLNTQRALNLAVDSNAGRAMEGVFGNYAQTMQQILGQTASAQNQKDQMVMRGAQSAGEADIADRDNYFSNLALNNADIFKAFGLTGKNLNQIKSRNTTGDMLSQISDFFGFDPTTGKISQKKVEFTTKKK